MLAAGLVFAAACGGDDDSSGGPAASSGGTGSDEAYVASICKAQLKFSTSFKKVMSDPSKFNDPEEVAKIFSAPMDQLVKDMKAAKPPKDAKEYHDQVVKSISDVSAQLKKSKDITSLDLSDDKGEPPAEIAGRLQKIADNNEDCKKADFSFTN